MIISSEQALRALRCLYTDQCGGVCVATRQSGNCELPIELLARVDALLSDMPETRPERVEQARAGLADGAYSSSEVADKIIARAISDKLR